jgi:TetR/AcrR family transcriptional repressor of nem operon
MRDTKNYILGIAFKLFMQKNYKEVTMKEIVEKTGLSKGAFYHYFESKEKLFFEIFNYFFSTAVNIDYYQYSKESLYRFYHDCLNVKDEFRIEFQDIKGKPGESYFDMNFFFLIFDGLKLFPEFRKRMEEFQEKELKAWTDTIKRARKNGEIKSVMSDQHIAMIFIHTSDGVAMNLVLNGNLENFKKELKLLWDEFYESLKA